MKVIMIDQRVGVVALADGARPALGNLGVFVSSMVSPSTAPVGAGDSALPPPPPLLPSPLPLLLLPTTVPSRLVSTASLETVPSILPLEDWLLEAFEESTPLISDASTLEKPTITAAMSRNAIWCIVFDVVIVCFLVV